MRVGTPESLHRTLGGLAIGLAMALAASTAQAASTVFNLNSSSGPGQLQIVLDDDVIPGAV